MGLVRRMARGSAGARRHAHGERANRPIPPARVRDFYGHDDGSSLNVLGERLHDGVAFAILEVWRAIMSSSLVRMVHTETELDWGWKLSRIIPTTAVDSVIEGYQRKSAIDGRSEVCQIRETRLPARPPASFSNSPGVE